MLCKLISTLGSNRNKESFMGVSYEVLLRTFCFQVHTIEQTGIQG